MLQYLNNDIIYKWLIIRQWYVNERVVTFRVDFNLILNFPLLKQVIQKMTEALIGMSSKPQVRVSIVNSLLNNDHFLQQHVMESNDPKYSKFKQSDNFNIMTHIVNSINICSRCYQILYY